MSTPLQALAMMRGEPSGWASGLALVDTTRKWGQNYENFFVIDTARAIFNSHADTASTPSRDP